MNLTVNAKKLLAGGLIGGHSVAIPLTLGTYFWVGGIPALSVLLGTALVLAFFTIGQGVQVVTANRDPKVVLVASLASYLIRVGGLGVLLGVLFNQSARVDLDARYLAGGVIVTVVGWLAAEVFTFTRLRILVFDEEQPKPSGLTEL